MTTERHDVERAADARAAMENPLVAEALGAWEQEITRAWQSSPLRDVQGRERLRLMLEASRTFRTFLEATIASGTIARATIETKPSGLLTQAGAIWRRMQE